MAKIFNVFGNNFFIVMCFECRQIGLTEQVKSSSDVTYKEVEGGVARGTSCGCSYRAHINLTGLTGERWKDHAGYRCCNKGDRYVGFS